MKGPTTPPARERLLQGLRGEGVQGLTKADWSDVIDLAQKHGVTPLLHRNLKARYADLQVPEPIRSRLRDTYRLTGIRNTRLLAQLNGVLKRFRQARVDVVVLKGAHLADLVYEEVALRPMGDVDLLIRSADLRAARSVLLDLEYRGPQGQGEHHQQEPIEWANHLDPVRKEGGLLVELHYAIGSTGLVKGPDVDGLWDRAVPVRIGGAEAQVLSGEDLLLHLCMHAALQHGFGVGLGHLCDIPAVLDHHGEKLEWAEFWERGRAWGAERSALLTFGLTERLLGWHRPEASLLGVSPPADLLDAIAMSERLLFAEGRPLVGSGHLVELWGDSNVIEKGRLILERVFPSREEMAFKFGVPATSWTIPMLYPVRLGQLLARYAGTVAGVVRRTPGSKAALDLARERSRVTEWLRHG
jgi:hypothetical protein